MELVEASDAEQTNGHVLGTFESGLKTGKETNPASLAINSQAAQRSGRTC